MSKSIKLLDVKKIWDKAPHNALTDLIFFKSEWYCVFRESDKHVYGKNGVIRLLNSADGIQWNSIKLFRIENIDLRDPKLSITPDGRLMLLIGGSIYDKNDTYISWQSKVAFSENGKKWTSFQLIIEPHEWLWRITWHNQVGYGVSYRFSDPKNKKKEWDIKLYQTINGIEYQLITKWNIKGYPNETTLRFNQKDEMIALVRRDKRFDDHAWIGKSKPPYKQWDWKESSYHFGGPNFLILPNQEMWASGRFVLNTPYGLFEKVGVAKLDNDIYPKLILPSGGIDTSYPGMVYYKRLLYISYYSSHENRTGIYLSKIELSPYYSQDH